MTVSAVSSVQAPCIILSRAISGVMPCLSYHARWGDRSAAQGHIVIYGTPSLQDVCKLQHNSAQLFQFFKSLLLAYVRSVCVSVCLSMHVSVWRGSMQVEVRGWLLRVDSLLLSFDPGTTLRPPGLNGIHPPGHHTTHRPGILEKKSRLWKLTVPCCVKRSSLTENICEEYKSVSKHDLDT